MKRALIALVAGLTFSVSHSADRSVVEPVAGTYELFICKSACSVQDHRNAFATATLVLLERPLSKRDVEQIDPAYFYEPANGCYTLHKIAEADSFAAATRTSVTKWQLEGDVLHFTLYRSPDAWYAVEVKRDGKLLEGTGMSAGAGLGNPGFHPDRVVGVLRGPAHISACYGPGGDSA